MTTSEAPIEESTPRKRKTIDPWQIVMSFTILVAVGLGYVWYSQRAAADRTERMAKFTCELERSSGRMPPACR